MATGVAVVVADVAVVEQGYTHFTDNCYTSQALATTLLQCNTHLDGIVRSNHAGFPAPLKSTTQLERHGERSDIQYARDDNIEKCNRLTTEW